MRGKAIAGLDDFVRHVNFAALERQARDIVNVQIAGTANKVTYIQAGELWFATLCISSFALFAVFVYAILYRHTLYKKRCVYDHVRFSQGVVHIVGMARDDDEEEDDGGEMRADEMRAASENIIPAWSCVAYLVCVCLISVHCLGRVLHSYTKALHERKLATTMQMFCSTMAWIASTIVASVYTWRSNVHPVHTTSLSWLGGFILYQLQRESVWALHVVTTLLVFDDILAFVAVTSYDVNSQGGTSLTDLLYIWLGLFTLYTVVFLVVDLWLNREVVIMPYILMVVVLCEIPARNHKSMSEDPASLGTSMIGLIVLMCLTARLVIGWARKGATGIPHFKSD